MIPVDPVKAADCLLVRFGRYRALLPASRVASVYPLTETPAPLRRARVRPPILDLRRLFAEPSRDPPVAVEWHGAGGATILLVSGVDALIATTIASLHPLPPGLVHLLPFCDAIWAETETGPLVPRLRLVPDTEKIDFALRRRLRAAATEKAA